MSIDSDYELSIVRGALKGLERIKKADRKTAEKVVDFVKELPTTPRPTGTRKLGGVVNNGLPVYRKRLGNYRILWQVQKDQRRILVLDINDRKNIYRNI